MSKPTLTTRLKIHLNGGHKYSARTDEILADGEPTGITIGRETDGRPEYNITSRTLHCERTGETVDLLAEGPFDVEAWVRERLPTPQAAEGDESP